MFPVCRGDTDQGHSCSLPPLVLCFSLFLLPLLSGDIQSKLKLCDYWQEQASSEIRLNGLNFQSFREYFWNAMKCVYISEPGPNPRQDE